MKEKISLLHKSLDEEVEWRISEIAALKTIPYMNNISIYNREVLMRYSIPAFYALWESYVVVSIEKYIYFVNSLNLSYDEIHPKIIAHDIDMRHDLKNGRVNLEPRIKFCVDLKQYFTQNVRISSKIPTKSNVSFKTINNILNCLNLEPFDKKKRGFQMDQLIKCRNAVAHGENSVKVDDKIIFSLSSTVINCMDDLTDSIVNGAMNKTYLNK